MTIPLGRPSCDPRLVEWLKMPLKAPEKKSILHELLNDESINFNCQRDIKYKLDSEAVISQGIYPIDTFDPERVTHLPLAITQIVQMGEMIAASELLDRWISPDFQTRIAAIRTGNLDFINRVFGANEWENDIRSFYLPAAIESGNTDVLEHILNIQTFDRETHPFSRGAVAVGETKSFEIAKTFIDFVDSVENRDSYIRQIATSAQEKSNYRLINYLVMRFPEISMHLDTHNRNFYISSLVNNRLERS
jgi:hypothetical protein